MKAKYKVLPKYPGEVSGYITATDRAAVAYMIDNNMLKIGQSCQTARKIYTISEMNNREIKINISGTEKSSFKIELI